LKKRGNDLPKKRRRSTKNFNATGTGGWQKLGHGGGGLKNGQ